MSVQVPTQCSCGLSLVVRPGYQHAVCDGCQRHWFPTSIESSEDGIVPVGKKVGFDCPRCHVPMEVGKIGRTQVCFCEQCRGFTVDSESLGGIIMAGRSQYAGPDDPPIRVDMFELEVQQNCPACFAKMEAHHYYGPGNVILDTCTGCQLAWLDHGELSKIIRASGPR